MTNEQENKITLKTFIPCKLVFPYAEYHTCVEVFRNLTFFDFPSLPRNIDIFMLIDASKGSYEIGMNIVDQEGNEIISEKSEGFTVDDNISVHFIYSFQNVIFPKEGKYFFQLTVNKEVVYKHDFLALKIQKQVYTQSEVEKILKDPETIKFSFATLTCGCGFSRNFSLSLDPEKQKEEEKLPEENIIQCKKCGKEIYINELKANMSFHLGTKNLADIFNRNLNESRILAINGFLNSSLIMQVSAFEAYMRDTFLLNYKNWFLHLIENKNDLNKNIIKIKKEIIKILDQMKIKNQFYDQIFVFGRHNHKSKLDEVDTYNETLKILLFGNDDEENKAGSNKIISFQQLKGEFGSFWAYKIFFGIDLKIALDSQKDRYNEHLINCFETRHKIIHGSGQLPLNKKEIDSDMIIKNEKIILFIKEIIKERINKFEDIRKETEKRIVSSTIEGTSLESKIEIK